MGIVKFGKLPVFLSLVLGVYCSLLGPAAAYADSPKDLFASQHHMRDLALVEREVAKRVAEYAVGLEKRLEAAKRFLKDFQATGLNFNGSLDVSTKHDLNNEQSKSDSVAALTAHPLRSFLLIRRLAKDLPDLQRQILLRPDARLIKYLEGVKTTLAFPTTVDWQGAAQGLIRLQDTYNLDINEFAAGNILGLQTNVTLSAADCFSLGDYALGASILTRAIQWLERAYNLVTFHGDKSIAKSKVSKTLQVAISKHNEELKSRTTQYLFTEPVSVNASLRGEGGTERRVRVLEDYPLVLYDTKNGVGDLLNFAAICRGEKIKGEKIPNDKFLKCWLETGQPRNTLMPLKIERVHRKPQVLQFHDLITDELIRKVLNFSGSTMARARVHAHKDDSYAAAIASRVSTATWLNDQHERSDVKELTNVYRRIEDYTGLRIARGKDGQDFSEEIQISCYGIGGHFNPHLDTIFNVVNTSEVHEKEVARGDRFATLMFYLSDVTKGGSTSFPRIGLNVKPSRGSAIFWYNMNDKGQPDELTLHGGCPTLYGNKCVANKWIRLRHQMCRRLLK